MSEEGFSSLLLSLLSVALLKTPEVVAFLITSITLFSFFYQIDSLSMGLWVDSISWSMFTLTLLVSSMVIFTSMKTDKMAVFILLSMLVALFFFFSGSIIYFFITFEMSLIPLTFLILSWGRQAERLLATQFMLIFTIVGSAPLLVLSVWKLVSESGPSLFLYWVGGSDFMNLPPSLLGLSMLAFLVKIPVFFFHSWLPKAHVEAPLEGSMILAGIMLKVGAFGMVRILMVLDIPLIFRELLFSVSMVGALASAIIALSSDDMKMSVAFSSISHMNMVVAAILSMKVSGIVAASSVMIAHGISSPLLFYLVTKIYQSTHSRSILISKGVLSKLPFLWLSGLLIWVVNISPPPFLPFLGEIMGFSSILSLLPWSSVWVCLFMVAGSFYSIVNFGIQAHSPFKMTMKSQMGDMLFPLLSLMMVAILLELFVFTPPLWSGSM